MLLSRLMNLRKNTHSFRMEQIIELGHEHIKRALFTLLNDQIMLKN